MGFWNFIKSLFGWFFREKSSKSFGEKKSKGLFASFFGEKKKDPLFSTICKLAGLKGEVSLKELDKYLFNAEQADTKKEVYLRKGLEATSLNELRLFVEQNFDKISKELPAVIKVLANSLFLWYIHAAQVSIMLSDKKSASQFVVWGLKYQKITRISKEDNPGFYLMEAYLENDLKAFEKLARNAVDTGWGWNGKNVYEREIVYGMQEVLKGRVFKNAEKEIQEEIDNGKIVIIDIRK